MTEAGQFLIQVFNGLQAGLVLYLVAAGLTLMFGVMRIVNLAHGALYTFGAYLAFGLAGWTGSFALAVLACIPVLVALGWVLDRFARGFLYSASPLQQILLTFALILVLDEVRAILWGNDFYSIKVPAALAGSISLGTDMDYPIYRIALSLVCLALALALSWFIQRTRFGQHVRAAADDREMLDALGVDSRRVFTLVMIGATVLSGLAGALSAPVSSVYPGMGDHILIASFVVVVIGGMGSLRGTWWAALLIGQIETCASIIAPGSAGILSFALMAAILAWRPHGLLQAHR